MIQSGPPIVGLDDIIVVYQLYRRSEVSDLQVVVRIYQQVLWLDVMVDDVHLVVH